MFNFYKIIFSRKERKEKRKVQKLLVYINYLLSAPLRRHLATLA